MTSSSGHVGTINSLLGGGVQECRVETAIVLESVSACAAGRLGATSRQLSILIFIETKSCPSSWSTAQEPGTVEIEVEQSFSVGPTCFVEVAVYAG